MVSIEISTKMQSTFPLVFASVSNPTWRATLATPKCKGTLQFVQHILCQLPMALINREITRNKLLNYGANVGEEER
jgi:hypothetical protein